ncbi:MAG TPA: nitrogen fixation protein NifM [Rhodocyclaceae bacterium]|nr:nitrogen fixation protein NifM [Rhodocyclaceae bacterium]
MQAYLQLKLSWELFKKAPDALSAPEKSRLDQVAGRQTDLERRILSSLEASVVIVPPATLAARIGEIRQRFASEEEFHNDLERIGLTQAALAEAVHRDLRVEAVLEKIACRAPAATEVDAEIFYRLHPEAFQRPEARRLRHILITFGNPAEREAARQQLEKLRHTVLSAEAFAAAALRHSQCPTALEGGKLGVVKRGDLYPELEPAAFALGDDELSPVVESPMGLHLLRCDEAFAAGAMDFGLVKQRIIDRLSDQRRRQAQKDWIAGL